MSINLKGASADERARFGTLVRPARQRAGMSQAELARIADVDRTTVSNIERGAFAPQPDVLRRLLRALGIATDEVHDDVEVSLWAGMIEKLLAGVPAEHRKAAADDALAAIAAHVVGADASEAGATIPRIDRMPRDDADQQIAAKRGAARRDERHAD